ncbi:hypothetical protein J6590_032804 [Homalodisca vitripennis]|nr:hypothetical protein J6590_032804 [Homalodisca vitripennis]
MSRRWIKVREEEWRTRPRVAVGSSQQPVRSRCSDAVPYGPDPFNLSPTEPAVRAEWSGTGARGQNISQVSLHPSPPVSRCRSRTLTLSGKEPSLSVSFGISSINF